MFYEISFWKPDYSEDYGFTTRECCYDVSAKDGWEAVTKFIDELGYQEATLITSINRIRDIKIGKFDDVEEKEFFPSREAVLGMIERILGIKSGKISKDDFEIRCYDPYGYNNLRTFLDEEESKLPFSAIA